MTDQTIFEKTVKPVRYPALQGLYLLGWKPETLCKCFGKSAVLIRHWDYGECVPLGWQLAYLERLLEHHITYLQTDVDRSFSDLTIRVARVYLEEQKQRNEDLDPGDLLRADFEWGMTENGFGKLNNERKQAVA